jgi:hypothetical protein
MDRAKVQKAANIYGVYAETESVKLFQLRRMKRRGLEWIVQKYKRWLTLMVCAHRQNR